MTENTKPKPDCVMICEGWAQTKYSQIRKTKSGKDYCQVSVSVYEGKDEDGKIKREYIKFTLWGDDTRRLSEIEGKKIRVTGRPKADGYEKKDEYGQPTGEHVYYLTYKWTDMEVIEDDRPVSAPVTQKQLDNLDTATGTLDNDEPF